MSRLSNWVNHNIPFEDEYSALFGGEIGYGNIFCPFHENNNTPSAKFYSDSNVVYCFSCQRTYTTYDLLERFNPNRLRDIAETTSITDEVYNDAKKVDPICVDYRQYNSAIDLAESIKVKLMDV